MTKIRSLPVLPIGRTRPKKQWKITEEDWRNRDKWDAYERAVNEMIQKTSTTYAPWHILESVDKKICTDQSIKDRDC